MIVKAPQLQAEQVLHGFVSRLASCSARCSDGEHVVSPGAKQLPCFLSCSVGNREATCSLPSLELMPHANKFLGLLSQPQAPKTVESSPAQNLGRPTRFNKIDIKDAPSRILCNFCSSFQSLVDERLRQAALSLIQTSIAQSRKTEMDGATAKAHARIIKRLFPSSTKPPISITAAVCNWATLPKKDSATPTTGKASLVQPIIFELVIDVNILQSKKKTIRISVPGTISAVFSRFTFKLETVRIELDTEALLSFMKIQCNDIVQKAIKLAYTECSVPDVSLNTRRENNASELQVDVDRKMMPPPPPRPPKTGYTSNKRKIEEEAPSRPTKLRAPNSLIMPAA